MAIASENKLLSAVSLRKALDFTVYNSQGQQLALHQVLSQTQRQDSRRVLVIFIRHFLCGNCQEYLRRLATTFQSLPESLRILVIGCGSPTLIDSYVKLVQCPFPIYSDPSSRLYQILGMHRSLALGPKSPDYIQHSLLRIAMGSIVQGLKRLPHGDTMKSGEWVVNGGEFLFESGSGGSSIAEGQDWDLVWCHRMRNTRDHAEMSELKSVLGLRQTPSDMGKKTLPLAFQPDCGCDAPPALQRSSRSLRRSLSLKRQSLSNAVANSGRSMSTMQRRERPVQRRPLEKRLNSDLGRGRTVAVG